MSLLEIISRNFICIISLVLLLILCLSNNAFEKRRTNTFVVIIAIVILLIIFDAIDIYLSSSTWGNAYIVRNISCFIIFSFCPIVPYLLIVITENKFKVNLKSIPLLINFILCSINLFTGFMFVASPENIFTRKPLYILTVLVSAFYLSGIVASYLWNFKTIVKAGVVFIVSVIFMALITLAMQIFHDVPFFLTSYIAIAMVFYYLFLNIQILRIDALTITLNRNVLEKELHTYHNGDKGVIIVFDLNDLKSVNDEYSHTKGDKFIVYTANLII